MELLTYNPAGRHAWYLALIVTVCVRMYLIFEVNSITYSLGIYVIVANPVLQWLPLLIIYVQCILSLFFL